MLQLLQLLMLLLLFGKVEQQQQQQQRRCRRRRRRWQKEETGLNNANGLSATNSSTGIRPPWLAVGPSKELTMSPRNVSRSQPKDNNRGFYEAKTNDHWPSNSNRSSTFFGQESKPKIIIIKRKAREREKKEARFRHGVVRNVMRYLYIVDPTDGLFLLLPYLIVGMTGSRVSGRFFFYLSSNDPRTLPSFTESKIKNPTTKKLSLPFQFRVCWIPFS